MTKERNKKTAEDVLADNFVRLRDRRKLEGLWKGPGVSQKTANNVVNTRHNTTVGTISRLAKALGVDPYQMLIPVEDDKFLVILQAWSQGDPSGRKTLYLLAEALVQGQKNEQSDRTEPATALRKRDAAA